MTVFLRFRAASKGLLFSLFVVLLFPLSPKAEEVDDFRAVASEKVWQEVLLPANFKGKKIADGFLQGIIELKAPFRAEDASMVPISVRTKIPQTSKRYIKKITLFIDKNPLPFVGSFEFSPLNGKADIATRVRVNDFSYIRAIAEMNTGELYMDKKFVRSVGGCSAPPPNSIEESIAKMGDVRIRSVGKRQDPKDPLMLQVHIRHPSITGLQPMEIGSRVLPPPHFVKEMTITYQNKTILKANMTFAISQDPSFRFYLLPSATASTGDKTVKLIATDSMENNFSGEKALTVL